METREASEARAALDALRSAIKAAVEESLQKGFWNRWPAGSPNSTGGQFAPKGNTGGGSAGGGGFKNYLGGLFGGGYGSGSYAPPKPKGPPPGAKPHPKVNDKGQPVTINYPSKPTHSSTWGDANKTAVFTPGSDAPDALNGVAMKTWNPPKDGWAKVTGTNEKLDVDLPFEANPKKSVGAGVLIVEDDGRVWLTRPTNSYGGYQNTYPKGTVEDGLTMQQNAIKEAYEETGLKVKIVGILGDYERDTSKARFYLARRTTGTPKNMGWESQAINLATLKDAKKLLNRTHDKQILDDLEDLLSFGPLKKAKGPVSAAWTMQPRWPSGSALGGQWKAMGADGVTLPPKIAGGIEGKNPVYQKKINAIHSAAQAGNLASLDNFIAQHKDADTKYASGMKGSSHLKWGASVYQYAVQVRGDVTHKTKASASADAIRGPKTLQSYGPQFAPKPGGSNPGAIYEDGNAKWLVKGNAQKVAGNVSDGVSDKRARNEVLAAKLMQAAGVGAPDMRLVDLQGKFGGGLGVASKMVDGAAFNPNNPAHVAAAQATFATHAWLANYDVLGMGYDNTIITPDGKAVCIDPGGALLFRAQGLPKGEAHGVKNGVLDTSAPEVTSMRQTTKEQSTVFGSMTQAQLQASAQQLATVSDETIKKLVDTYGPPDANEKNTLTVNLIARRDAVLAQIGGAQALKAAETDDPLSSGVMAAAAAQAMTMDPYTAYKAAADMVAQAEKSAAELLADGGLSSKDFKLAMLGELPKMATTAQQVIVAKINNLTNAGDQTGLANYALELQATLKGVSGFDAQAKNYAQMGLVAATMAKMEAAQGIAPPSSVPQTPVFSTGTKYADQYYNSMVAKFAEQHAAGNLAALQSFSGLNTGKLYPDGVPWKSGTANGIKAATYHAALVKDLQAKQGAQVTAAAAQADKAIATPVPPPKDAKPLPAMPNFDKALLPLTNSNASSHNSKVGLIKTLAEKGDVKGLLSLGYSTNTYGNKQALLANSALKALGSTHYVVTGQKAGQHPALNGGVSPQRAAAAAKTVKQQPPPPHPVATTAKAGKVNLSKLDMSKAIAPAMPTFSASSKAWVNEQNNKLAQQIQSIFQSGDYVALRNMTYESLDKETGNILGSKPLSEHPAKELNNFYEGCLSVMNDVANPPAPLKQFSVGHATSVSQVSAAFPSKKYGTTISKVAANEKIGFWIGLGKIDNPDALMPKKTMDVTNADISKASADYVKMSNGAKAFVKMVQSGGVINAYRQGKKTYQGNDLKQVASEALKYAQEKPEGTTVYRWQNMTQDMINKLVQSGPGTVMQCSGPMPTSYSPTATSHFGQHRVEIVYAKGAKAIDSHGSGGYSSEKEISILPNTRFILQSIKKNGNRYDLRVLMLPPDWT